jgi:UDP-N-acetylglucosamine enolpyruvyl transferase
MMAAVLKREKPLLNALPVNRKSLTGGILIKMGAKIKGYGTPIIEIRSKQLRGRAEDHPRWRRHFDYRCLITRGDITNIMYQHLGALIDKFWEVGAYLQDRRLNARALAAVA